MRSVVFIAAMFVMGLCGLLVGGIDLYRLVDFQLHSREAQMELAEAKRVLPFSVSGGTQLLHVRYLAGTSSPVVRQRVFDDTASRLENGERIPIVYLTNDPEIIFLPGEQPETPWVWLIVGIAAMATFVFSWKLLRKEQRQGVL